MVDGRARSHWLVGLGTAAMVHAGLATALFWKPTASSAQSAGFGGIEISLGPAGGAAGTVSETPPPTEQKQEPKEEPAQETPVTPPDETRDVATQPDMPPPVPPPAEVPKPVTAPQPPKPKPRMPEPPKKVVKAEPISEKIPPREPERPPEPQPATKAPSVAGVEGKAGTQVSRNAGNADDSAGGGIPGRAVDYMAILQAWLEKHKEYPRNARLRRMEGTTLLYFVMDRDGKVLDFRIQKSSGFDLLDHEVEAMIQRAQPLPQMPDSMSQARLELVVPVQFLLR
jgi:protein TonB